MKIKVSMLYAGIAQNKITMTELAKRTGLAKQSISAIIHRGSCSPKTVGKIADALGVDVKEIIVTEDVKEDG